MPTRCRRRTGSSGSSRISTHVPSSPRSPGRASSTARPPPCTGWRSTSTSAGTSGSWGCCWGIRPCSAPTSRSARRPGSGCAAPCTGPRAEGARRPRSCLAIQPDMEVEWDPNLKVGVSARPFATASGFWRRIRWAFGTLALDWESPIARRAARRQAASRLALVEQLEGDRAPADAGWSRTGCAPVR